MLNLKPTKQLKGYCGPASLKIVMEFYGIIKSQKQWAKLIKTTIKGTSEEEIIKVAKKLGFKAYVKQNSSLNELKELNKKGIPTIVNWFSPEEAGHYSIIAGFDGKNILIADPHFGKIIKKPIVWFEQRWFDYGFEKYQTKREIIVIKR